VKTAVISTDLAVDDKSWRQLTWNLLFLYQITMNVYFIWHRHWGDISGIWMGHTW